VTVVLLAAAFAVVYPLANSGVIGPGSDRDEALNIATTELLEGRYPYYPKTYFGLPISPMPGSLFLAAPFMLLGNAAYQNLFWIAAFAATVAWFLKDLRPAVGILLLVLALAPVVINEFVVGGDLLANTLYVLLAIMWLLRLASDARVAPWAKYLLAAALGVALASRANFALLVPLVFSALMWRVGLRQATQYIALAGLTFALVVVPFYLYDPAGFSPLHTASYLAQFESVLPFANVIVPAVTVLLALLLATRGSNASLTGPLRHCTLVLACPVVMTMLLASIQAGTANFTFAAYGLPFVLFGAMAFFPRGYQAGLNA